MISSHSFSSKNDLDNKKIELFTIRNKSGIQVSISNYGGIITAIEIPIGLKMVNTVLGFKSYEDYRSKDYLNNYAYLGAIIGRYANRINNSKFKINSYDCHLSKNEGKNHLHGGIEGFDKKIWTAKIISQNKLELSYLSQHMEEGYPGNLQVSVKYELTERNELKIKFNAKTDKKTIVNLTQHPYFNLNGNKSIKNHKLKIYSNRILKKKTDNSVCNCILDIKDTIFDFSTNKTIGANFNEFDDYDHCYIFDNKNKSPKLMAELSSDDSPIKVQILSTYPSMQLYAGKHLNISKPVKLDSHSGIAIEPQFYPNGPNFKKDRHAYLSPKETYREEIIYRFKIGK
ncbi:MAG: galactose mutarotase [Marinifilaceae bacterium]|jgi:aldose 1-epimerase|nr:galactose mutarotase [Marinifilaceae bacterium]